MIEIHVRTDVDLRKLAENYGYRLPDLIEDEADQQAKLEAYAVRDEAKTYEPSPGGKPFIWKSERQRRYVMAAIRQGTIQVPYQRTGDMSRQTVAYRKGKGIWVAEMRAPYSKWVRGDQQSHQHVGRWKTWTAIVHSHAAGRRERFVEAIRRAIARL